MDESEKLAKAQKLSEKAQVPFEEARTALEQNNWDMLDALLFLQNKEKTSQAQSAEYTTQGNNTDYNNQYNNQYQYQNEKSSSFGEAIGKGVKWFVDLVKKGMDNDFLIERKTMNPIRIPITVAVIILILLNGLTLVALIVGLFFGFRYSFQGPNINSSADDVNDALHRAGKSAEEFTQDIKDGFRGN